ncbi:MAG: glycosyltransferase family A protein [Candidatus Nezhaarchaeales archaeon]
MVFVSIIIPTHNRTIELLNALLHLMEQKYKDFEIVIVDDSDEPYKRMNKKIIGSLSKILTVKYMEIPPTYTSIARNIGIRHSNGNYIAFLDDDDYWLPEKLLAQMRRTEEGYDFIFTGFMKVNRKGEIVYRYRPQRDVIKNPLKLLSRSNFIATSSVLVKKRLLEDVGCFDESLPALEDYDCWLKIAEVDEEFATVKDALTVVTESRSSLSKDDFKQALALIRFSMRHRTVIGEEKSLSLLIKACEHLKRMEKADLTAIHTILRKNVIGILRSIVFNINLLEEMKSLTRLKLLTNLTLCLLPFGSRYLIKLLWFLNDTLPPTARRFLSLIVI